MNSMGLFNLIPTNSPSPVSEDSFPEHDHIHFDESLDDNGLDGDGQGKRKSRRPPSTAERRANHNAVERARRESLNGRFMDLAGALPNMANVKRPSKSVIVAKSLEFVQGAQAREQYLMGQNDSLRQEINELRARLGMPALTGSPVTMNGAAALPALNRARNGSSTSSSHGTDSPQMSTPVTLTSFEAPPAQPASFTFNTAYASAFPSAGQAPVVNTAIVAKDNNQARSPTATQAAFTRPVPALDVNYLMALSLQQQQQQQNLLNMQGMASGYPAMAPWMIPHNGPAPVAAGGDSPWLFS